MTFRLALLAASAATGFAGAAAAAPIFFAGHWYEYVAAQDVAWTTARAAAAGLANNGQAGYLATVTSAAENEFIRASFSLGAVGFAGAWLGAEVTADGRGVWATGPETGQQFSIGNVSFGGAYENWGGIEPNNAPGFGYMNVGSAFAGIANGEWADAGGGLSSPSDPIRGYVVEYNGGVPEPGAWALMILGFAAAGATLRARRRKLGHLRP